MSTTMAAGLMMLMCVLVGCDAPATDPSPPLDEVVGLSKAEQSRLLTAEAAGQLDGDGFFLLRESDASKVTLDQVTQFANTFASRWGWQINNKLARETQAQVNGANLVPCGRTLFADSPYDEVDIAIADVLTQRRYGGFWQVILCDNEVPRALLHLSGVVQLDGPDPGLNTVYVTGFPDGDPTILVHEPEDVVRIVVQATGNRVAAIPQLSVGEAPWFLRWRVTLDGPQRFRTDKGVSVSTDVLYFGRVPNQGASGYRPTFSVASQGDAPAELRVKTGVASSVQLATPEESN